MCSKICESGSKSDFELLHVNELSTVKPLEISRWKVVLLYLDSTFTAVINSFSTVNERPDKISSLRLLFKMVE